MFEHPMVSMLISAACWDNIVPHVSFGSYGLGLCFFRIFCCTGRELDQAFGEMRKWWRELVWVHVCLKITGSKISCLTSCLIITSIQLVILGYPLCFDTHVTRPGSFSDHFSGETQPERGQTEAWFGDGSPSDRNSWLLMDHPCNRVMRLHPSQLMNI